MSRIGLTRGGSGVELKYWQYLARAKSCSVFVCVSYHTCGPLQYSIYTVSENRPRQTPLFRLFLTVFARKQKPASNSQLAARKLPNRTDAVLGGDRGHSLALHTAVPGLLRVRRLRGSAGELRGVLAVFGVRDPRRHRDGPSRRRPSQLIIARCPRDAGSACPSHPCVCACAGRAGRL